MISAVWHGGTAVTGAAAVGDRLLARLAALVEAGPPTLLEPRRVLSDVRLARAELRNPDADDERLADTLRRILRRMAPVDAAADLTADLRRAFGALLS